WRTMTLARRARGLGDHGALRRFLCMAFVLLVFAVRRGTTLATAMEARGFGAPVERTWSRPSRLHPRDGVALAGAVVVIG
ncbi:energy-coupling factor transporter transmembrane component T family protein, partial [Streptomyces europaeiscabiei]|uniref:energy-coupling factor transporter transmembrane component T family protein n=1 Tax=Streptomyces europaeiscabiei TaxID=146819 RepID=UPI0038F73153